MQEVRFCEFFLEAAQCRHVNAEEGFEIVRRRLFQDICDIDARKWPAAQALGAKHTIDPSREEAAAQLAALSGGVWGVLDLVGAESTAKLGLASLRKGGRYVVVGLYGGEIPISLVPMAQRVAVLGIPCDPRWRTAVGIDTVGPRYFGYDVDYEPIEERLAWA